MMAAAAEAREKLRAIADELRAKAHGRASLCKRGAEWMALPAMNKMAVLLLAGLDGDLRSLSKKAWSEFTPDEKISIQVAMRSLFDSLGAAAALRAKVA